MHVEPQSTQTRREFLQFFSAVSAISAVSPVSHLFSPARRHVAQPKGLRYMRIAARGAAVFSPP